MAAIDNGRQPKTPATERPQRVNRFSVTSKPLTGSQTGAIADMTSSHLRLLVHRCRQAQTVMAGSKVHENKSHPAVIDTMAFRTNLLALNAGVEASKRFAVVAQEVPESRCRQRDQESHRRPLVDVGCGCNALDAMPLMHGGNALAVVPAVPLASYLGGIIGRAARSFESCWSRRL
ncbi:hypothetical protein HJA76_13405 [Rhizobium bangladeshense]|uniref:hypothetical protein n=1 Tax=Rhizobium bangladeshense TaxID=1138189 RepID=UPI001C840012|nr:hypothetical protein [Rhizobium bangladeshense]